MCVGGSVLVGGIVSAQWLTFPYGHALSHTCAHTHTHTHTDVQVRLEVCQSHPHKAWSEPHT